jgi:hypothetical protein
LDINVRHISFSQVSRQQRNRLGRGKGKALAGYFAEVQQISETLNGRYDDLKGGKIKPIPGDEVEAQFREKNVARTEDLPVDK